MHSIEFDAKSKSHLTKHDIDFLEIQVLMPDAAPQVFDKDASQTHGLAFDVRLLQMLGISK